MITSIFIANFWGGFEFNNDGRWAPGRALDGGPNAYLIFNDGSRVDIPNMWACVVDVAACMTINPIAGVVNQIEAVNLVHLHELCHACDDGDAERYDREAYSHTYYWNKTLIPLSKIGGTDQFMEAEVSGL